MIHVSLLPFLFGFAAERLLKEIGKFAVGRLRPYFFAVCQPVLADGTSCEWEENQGKYIEHHPQQQQEHREPVAESVASTYVTPATSLSEVPSCVTEVQVQP